MLLLIWKEPPILEEGTDKLECKLEEGSTKHEKVLFSNDISVVYEDEYKKEPDYED